MSGEGNPYFGRKHDDVVRKRISERIAQTLSVMSEEERKACFARDITGERNPFFGRRHGDETRQNVTV